VLKSEINFKNYKKVMKPYFDKGFTLLEMVLVLFILAIIAATSLSFIENEDGQLRFQESMQKFDSIYKAMISERESRGSSFLSGFIVDNGSLPDGITDDLDPITSNNTDWSSDASEVWVTYDYLLPYYFNTAGTETQLADQERFRLGKGFRGPYIRNGLDSSNDLKDGWGEDFAITTATTTEYTYTFGSSSQITHYPFSVNVSNIARTIDEDDWSILPSSLNITVNNDNTSSQTLRLAVVVFKNDSVASNNSEDGDLWQTFYFDVTLAASTSTNSSSETWQTGGGAPNITRIPAGEHLVILELDDTPDVIVDVARLTVFPNSSTQPEVTLTAP
jgi:prepilin-type N-terminal cleavage/methylation domain-containing protein